MTSEPRSASRNGWKLPFTTHLSWRPLTVTSLTPEARATCRAGGVLMKVTWTRCVGRGCVMPRKLMRRRAAHIV
jgi:hypothetical protein